MKIYLLISFVSIYLASCNHNNDPFKDIKFGTVNNRQFVTSKLQENILHDPQDDSTSFRYFLFDGKDSLPVVVKINYDGYNTHTLRQLRIDLGGDTIRLAGFKNPAYGRGLGGRMKTDIDKIYALYIKWYGKPDSLKKSYPRKIQLLSEEELLGKKEIIREVDSSAAPSIRACWIRNNCKIILTLTAPKMNTPLEHRIFIIAN